MKRLILLAVLFVLITPFVSSAAGTWGTIENRKGFIDGTYTNIKAISYEFTADAANGSVPDLIDTTFGGKVIAIDYEFGSPVPNSVTLVVKTTNNITVYTGGAVVAAGRVIPATPFYLAGGMKWAITTNTTNNAKCKIIFYVET